MNALYNFLAEFSCRESAKYSKKRHALVLEFLEFYNGFRDRSKKAFDFVNDEVNDGQSLAMKSAMLMIVQGLENDVMMSEVQKMVTIARRPVKADFSTEISTTISIDSNDDGGIEELACDQDSGKIAISQETSTMNVIEPETVDENHEIVTIPAEPTNQGDSDKKLGARTIREITF